MAEGFLNIESLKALLHHLVHRTQVDEATQTALHSQVDDLDQTSEEIAAREAENAAKVVIPPGWEEVPDHPGTFRPVTSPR